MYSYRELREILATELALQNHVLFFFFGVHIVRSSYHTRGYQKVRRLSS